MENKRLVIEILSFAYKANSIPRANLLFDVRFIDNPFWIEELRPLTGLNKNVQNFVLKQSIAGDFLAALKEMIKVVIPLHTNSMAEKTGAYSELDDLFTIAFGCTGGQHRSVAIVEETARLINELFPQYPIKIWHREIGERRDFSIAAGHKAINEEAKL